MPRAGRSRPPFVRISGRFTCGGCGEGYHDSFKPTSIAGTCDKCGSVEMKRRADDNAETVAQRLQAYHAETAPLITYYDAAGVLARVNAIGAIDQIASDLSAVVSEATA
ncbi:MAG: hypothetical protein KJO30_13380 [Boseongicola sp.]|nr:hypothetical protein [Boseongicola sp.]